MNGFDRQPCVSIRNEAFLWFYILLIWCSGAAAIQLFLRQTYWNSAAGGKNTDVINNNNDGSIPFLCPQGRLGSVHTVTTRVNTAKPLSVLLVTPVLFLLRQFTTSAVTRIYHSALLLFVCVGPRKSWTFRTNAGVFTVSQAEDTWAPWVTTYIAKKICCILNSSDINVQGCAMYEQSAAVGAWWMFGWFLRWRTCRSLSLDKLQIGQTDVCTP